jgi:hypothetical protein
MENTSLCEVFFFALQINLHSVRFEFVVILLSQQTIKVPHDSCIYRWIGTFR